MNLSRTLLLLSILVTSCVYAQESTDKQYYKDGTLKSERFIYPDGHYVTKDYFTDGTLSEEYFFNKKSEIDGTISIYFESGKLACKKNYVNGILEGVSTWYYENGSKQIEKTYKNGKLDGVEKTYSDAEVLISEITWVDGVQNGVVNEYFSNGNLYKVSEYKNGEILESKTFGATKLMESLVTYNPVNGTSTSLVYKGNRVTTKVYFNKTDHMVLMLHYDDNKKLTKAVYKRSDLRPDIEDLMDFLGSAESASNYDNMILIAIGKILSTEEIDPDTFNKNLDFILDKMLLPYLLNKAASTADYDIKHYDYEAAITFLQEKYLQDITVEIPNTDLTEIVKHYNAELKEFDLFIDSESDIMGYPKTQSGRFQAKTDFLKFKKLYEQNVDAITQEELAEYIDSNFIAEYLSKAKNISDKEKRNIKLMQIKSVLEDLSLGESKVNYAQRSAIYKMLKQIVDIDTVQTIKLDIQALRLKLKPYVEDWDKYDIGKLVALAFDELIGKYNQNETLEDKELALIFGDNSIYDFIKKDPDRATEIFLLDGFFIYNYSLTKKSYGEAISEDKVTEIFCDFDKYTQAYGIKPSDFTKITTFEDFKKKVRIIEAELKPLKK